jgi:hypothetical protein
MERERFNEPAGLGACGYILVCDSLTYVGVFYCVSGPSKKKNYRSLKFKIKNNNKRLNNKNFYPFIAACYYFFV